MKISQQIRRGTDVKQSLAIQQIVDEVLKEYDLLKKSCEAVGERVQKLSWPRIPSTSDTEFLLHQLDLVYNAQRAIEKRVITLGKKLKTVSK